MRIKHAAGYLVCVALRVRRRQIASIEFPEAASTTIARHS